MLLSCMLFCFDKSVFGTDLHLLYDSLEETYEWTNEINQSCWSVGGKDRDLLKALSLAGYEIAIDPPEKFVKSFLACSKQEKGPWQKLMPEKIWISWVEQSITNIVKITKQTDLSYYNDVYKKYEYVLQSLKSAKINKEKLNLYLENTLSEKFRLKSFCPNSDGFVSPPIYNQNSTISGRLTVDSGPEILNLKKEYRDIIISRYENGSIYQLDYQIFVGQLCE